MIMMSKGMIRIAHEAFSPTTSLAHAAVGERQPGGDTPQIVQIADVEEALMLGADAVVLFTALGGDTEAGMIDMLAAVGRECAALGMPFIAEAEFPTTYATVEELKQQYGFEYLRRNVRLCAELGADIVKTNWPGDADSFGRCVEAANGIPVVLAGGSRLEDGGAPDPDGAGDGGRRDRLLRGTEHLHARDPEAHHARPVARDPRTLDRGEGPRVAPGGDGLMRAAFMTGVNEVEVRDDVAEPKLDPAGALLRVEACGICGTDARTFFNGDPEGAAAVAARPRAGGHPRGGRPRRRAAGRGRAGDRVFLGSILTCGECRWCMEGFQNLCEHHLLYGYDPYPGAYADLASVPPIAVKNLIPLPA